MISVTTALLLLAPFLHEPTTSHYHKTLPHITPPPPPGANASSSSPLSLRTSLVV